MATTRAGLLVFGMVLLAHGAGNLHDARDAPSSNVHTTTPSDSAPLPLEPSRTVSFATEQGTWLSLDVSPDGARVVFDLLGDLYTLPIKGGPATRITSGMAFDAQPRYSPDGTRLVFTSDRDGWTNIWVANSDGSDPKQLTRYRWALSHDRVASPVWTPDGRAVVVPERFRSSPTAGTRLVEYDVETKLARPLTNLGEENDRLYLGPAFGKDPDVIYAAVRAPESFSGTLWQIARINRRTLDVELETNPSAGRHAMRPALSRDGRFLVYGSPSGEGTGLRLRNMRTGAERWLVRRAQRDVTAWAVWDGRDLLPGSAFTPDGNAFLTSYSGNIWRIDTSNGQATQIPFRAEVEQRLGPLVKFQYPFADEAFDVRAIRNPEISPDGSRVIFSALDRIWVADLPAPQRTASGCSSDEGTVSVTPRRVTDADEGEFFPAWSPDGRYIAYTTWNDDSGGAIRRVRSSGLARPERLTNDGAAYFKTAWNTSGTHVLAVRANPERWRDLGADDTPDDGATSDVDLVTLPATGGTARSLGSVPVTERVFTQRLQHFVYGKPHTLSGIDRVLSYEQDTGLVAVSLADKRREVWLRFDENQADDRRVPGVWPPFEVLLSPDMRHLLALRGGSNLPVLLGMQDPVPRDRAIPSLDRAGSPTGMSRRDLSSTPADFIGWTRTSIPYYSVGGSLFVGSKAPDGADDPELTFRRIDIKLRIRANRPSGALVLRGARAITMRGQEVIERADILVRNGRIAAVGPQAQVAIPRNVDVLDFTGKTILPGLVDIHDHVYHAVSWGIHAEQEWRLLVDLSFGVTTIRDPVGGSTDLMALQERAHTGDLVSPRIYTVWPTFSRYLFGDGSTQDLESTRDVLQLWSRFYRTETIKQYSSGGRRTRQLLAIAAREQGVTPTNEGGWNTAMGLTMALDGYAAIEHAFPATPQYRDVVQLMVQSGTIQTHTLSADKGLNLLYRRWNPWADSRLQRFVPPEAATYLRKRHRSSRADVEVGLEPFLEIAAQPAKIVAAGGCVGLGSHGNLPGLGAHWEMWTLALGGMPPHDVLRVATRCSAEAIGHGADVGSIEPGKIADLQVLNHNPLENIHHTSSTVFVMKGGRLYDALTLAEVWPRSTPPVRMWWHKGARSTAQTSK